MYQYERAGRRLSRHIGKPATAQFFSPDPFVQEAGNWQNYNRYSYVYNNPLIFTDPSGYRKKSLEEQKMDFLYQYDPVRDTSPVRILSGGGDFSGTLSRYDINNAYRDVLSSGYEGSVYDFTRLLSNTRDGKVSYWIDVENTISYEQIMYYKLLFSEFSALGFIPELTKASKKITVDFGSENNTNWAKFFLDASSAYGTIYQSQHYITNIFGNGRYISSTGKVHTIINDAPISRNTFVKSGAANTAKALRPLTRTLNFAGYATTIYSGVNFMIEPNFQDGFDTGLGVASMIWWRVGVYSAAASAMVVASTGERMQIQENILNNRCPIENVYVPGLGTTYNSPF